MSETSGSTTFGPNAWLVDEMHDQYLEDPSSVSESWQDFFADYRKEGGRAEAAPRDGGAVTAPPAPTAATSAAPAAPAPAAPAPAPAVPVTFQNCAAVRAAGAAPIRPGDPGWEQKFDGDGDGVGCDS